MVATGLLSQYGLKLIYLGQRVCQLFPALLSVGMVLLLQLEEGGTIPFGEGAPGDIVGVGVL
jgi:hypothetical protein